MQGDDGGCESERDQQAAETDPGASTAARGDRQPAEQRDQQTDLRDSPRGRVVEGRRKHRGPELLLPRPSPQVRPQRSKQSRHHLEDPRRPSCSCRPLAERRQSLMCRRRNPIVKRAAGVSPVPHLARRVSYFCRRSRADANLQRWANSARRTAWVTRTAPRYPFGTCQGGSALAPSTGRKQRRKCRGTSRSSPTGSKLVGCPLRQSPRSRARPGSRRPPAKHLVSHDAEGGSRAAAP